MATVLVTWVAAGDNPDAPADYFSVKRSSDGGLTFAEIAQVPENASRQYLDTVADGDYVYGVSAVDAQGDESTVTQVSHTAVTVVPNAPVSVSASNQ